MMNLVDAARDGEERRFGPGYFDLVIIDEAHRSVYQKYGALFDWFDGLLLGLTATPVDDIARSTYRLFELEPGVPTDSYPLEEAIGEGYLVGPENLVYDLGFHRSGIRYDQLSEEEKEQWEEIDWDEGEDSDPLEEMPTAVEAPRVFRSLFNADTADKALAELMRAGHRLGAPRRAAAPAARRHRLSARRGAHPRAPACPPRAPPPAGRGAAPPRARRAAPPAVAQIVSRLRQHVAGAR